MNDHRFEGAKMPSVQNINGREGQLQKRKMQ
jgi:hypothetical protein